MEDFIKIKDDAGELTISYADMLKYHGRDFYGGVALALKTLQLAFRLLFGKEVPHRNTLRLVVGFDPPGVIDGLEFVTRAVTRRRLILEPDPPVGAESVFGRYYFEVHHLRRCVRLWLNPGLLPAGFTDLARKALAGTAEPDELARWKVHKQDIGRDLMNTPPEQILDFEGPENI